MVTLPKVSVIIPNYNHERYLSQRIDSVLHQTYKNLEIIILDDCSPDNSVEVIRTYENNPLVKEIILNKVNSGSPFRQWQHGVQKARGEWIWIAESDDYADPLFLERLIGAVERVPDAGLVYCDSKIVNDLVVSETTFAALKNEKLTTTRWSEDHVNNGVDEIENYVLQFGTINNTSAVLFNREILLEADPFDIDLRFIGDKYAFLKVLALSNIVYVKDSLNYYRNPFTTKHFDKFILYFYEHFLIFDWVHRNLRTIDKKKFSDAFYANIRNSLFRGWNRSKILIYLKLFKLNRLLFFKSIHYNFGQSVASFFGSIRRASARLITLRKQPS